MAIHEVQAPGQGGYRSDKDAEGKREQERVSEERDILEKAAVYVAKESR